MIRRLLTVALVLLTATIHQAGTASADHLVIEVSGREEVIVGEDLQISASVRRASDGEPADGLTVEFFGNSFFAGVTGEILLGSAVTNSIGVATFDLAFSVRGVHRVRVEVHDGPEIQEAEVIVGVDHGPQIISSEAGVDIPGVGSWLVTAVIGAVWAVMLLAAVWMVRVSRSGGPEDEDLSTGLAEDADPTNRRRRGRFNVALVATALMTLLAVGLVTLLIRGPDTHHNFDPEGYTRSPVAYLDAAYVYPGPGLAGDDALTGDALNDGRALFLKSGCAGCHGLDAQGTASARSPAFATRQWLGTVVRTGLPGGMPAYALSDVTDTDLDLMQVFLLDARDVLANEAPVGGNDSRSATTTTVAQGGGESTPPPFDEVLQILQSNCSACHGQAGGWSADDYDAVINSGDNGPAVIPGDPDQSILAQKLLGTQTLGTVMPPGGGLSDSDIQAIVDWIEAGASS